MLTHRFIAVTVVDNIHDFTWLLISKVYNYFFLWLFYLELRSKLSLVKPFLFPKTSNLKPLVTLFCGNNTGDCWYTSFRICDTQIFLKKQVGKNFRLRWNSFHSNTFSGINKILKQSNYTLKLKMSMSLYRSKIAPCLFYQFNSASRYLWRFWSS